MGKHNWHIIYSIAKTAKANNLKPYNYFEFLLTEIQKHMENTTLDFLDDLLPWSENLPDECKKQNK
uniref:transposase domain-containing protein n=1 Tax=Clostridium butyricum TaxID=1492 RepID=UPI002ABD9E52|nr:transposase domain-containing protein [Clostridium butyricum]